jgi:excisionase family DNA binding protein
MERRWYSITEAADLLGVSHDTVSRLIDRGELPAIRVSKRIVRIPIPAFDFYASGRTPTKRRIVRRRVEEGVRFGLGEDVGELEKV